MWMLKLGRNFTILLFFFFYFTFKYGLAEAAGIKGCA